MLSISYYRGIRVREKRENERKTGYVLESKKKSSEQDTVYICTHVRGDATRGGHSLSEDHNLATDLALRFRGWICRCGW